MSIESNYKIIKNFKNKFDKMQDNPIIIKNNELVYNFMCDLKKALYTTIYKELEPNKDYGNNEKLIRNYVKLIIKDFLPFCDKKIKETKGTEYYSKWFDLEDDYYAMASFRSLKHFAFYIERGNNNKIWRDTIQLFESTFYYASSMVLNQNVDLIRASFFPGAGKTYFANILCAWWFGIEEISILRITYSDKLVRKFTKQILNIIETKQYKKVFPKFDLDSKELYRVKTNEEIWFKFYNTTSFYATTRYGQSTGNRAKVLIIDDITKGKEEAYKIDIHENIIDMYDSDWSSRADEGIQRQFLLGTMWSPYDLLNEVEKRAKKYNEIVRDDRFDKYCTKTSDSKNIFISVPILDYETDESTCPARYPTEEMRKKRDNFRDKALFNAVYQQRPEAPLELIFDRRNLNLYNEKNFPKSILNGEYECRGMIDPTRKGYDYFAFGIFKRYMVDEKNEIWSKWYLVDCIFRRDMGKRMINEICTKIIKHKMSKLTIEINTATELADLIDNSLIERGWNVCEFQEIFSYEKKEERISNSRLGIIEEIVYPEQFVYSESSEMGQLMTQFTTYDITGDNKHDDATDMISMFVKYNCEEEMQNELEILDPYYRF